MTLILRVCEMLEKNHFRICDEYRSATVTPSIETIASWMVASRGDWQTNRSEYWHCTWVKKISHYIWFDLRLNIFEIELKQNVVIEK